MAIDADWRDAAWGERARPLRSLVATSAELDEAARATSCDACREQSGRCCAHQAITWPGTDDWPRLLEERAAMSGTLVLSDYTRRAIAAFAARGSG